MSSNLKIRRGSVRGYSRNAAKSMLARMMAGENIAVRHDPTATTAMFEVVSRVLILPAWKDMSDDLYDMFIAHEIAHARITPVSFYNDILMIMGKPPVRDHEDIQKMSQDDLKAYIILKDYFNVVEDARIEKYIKRRFPGCRKNFVVGYQELWERDFFGVKDKVIKDLPFIDRLNLHFKVGHIERIPFHNDFEKEIVMRTSNVIGWNDLVGIVADMWDYEKMKAELKSDLAEKVNKDKKEEEEQEDVISLPLPGGVPNDKPQNNRKSRFNKPLDEMSADEVRQKMDELYGKKDEKERKKIVVPESALGQPKNDSGKDNVPGIQIVVAPDQTKDNAVLPDEVLTQREFDNKFVEKYRDTSGVKIHYVDFPPANNSNIFEWKDILSNEISGSDTHHYRQFMNEIRPSITRMIQEFKRLQSAKTHSKSRVAKTGQIDVNVLHRYKIGEDIFKQNRVVHKGKNHGFLMFVDFSSSMNGCILATMRQLICQIEFARKLNVPYEVYGFSNWEAPNTGFDIKPETIEYRKPYRLINLFSSEMNNRQHSLAASYYLKKISDPQYGSFLYRSGTPLFGCIFQSKKLIDEFIEKKKIDVMNVIYLTDGEPSDRVTCFHDENGSIESLQRIVMKGSNIEMSHLNVPSCLDHIRITNEHRRVNVIGFFLTSNLPSSNEKIIDQGSFSYADDHGGYDRHFWIDQNQMNFKNASVKDGGDLTSVMNANKANKIFLNRFVEMLA